MARHKGTKNKTLHIWTEEEKVYLKKIVKGRHYKEIVKLMNIKFDYDFTETQIKCAIGRYKFNTGLTGQFKRGDIPFNKGKKGLTSVNINSFKKGQIPANYRPVGSERVNVDGYIEVKIKDPNKWSLKHKVIWENHNGTIPKGHAIIFGDGNRENLDINNLILVSRQQLLILNRKKLITNDVNLTRTGIIIADIYQKISNRSKGDLK